MGIDFLFFTGLLPFYICKSFPIFNFKFQVLNFELTQNSSLCFLFIGLIEFIEFVELIVFIAFIELMGFVGCSGSKQLNKRKQPK